MFHSFSLGKLAGIDIRVHPSLVLAAVWVSYEFGYAAGEGFPGVVFGLTLLTVILGCVVMHELGHSFMAREFGSGTRDITLYPLGGAAYIERMPANPEARSGGNDRWAAGQCRYRRLHFAACDRDRPDRRIQFDRGFPDLRS